MANTLVRVYDRLSDAERAREQLLGAGFAASRVHLVSKEDEAGPVQGNFIVGNADSPLGGIRGLIDLLTGADDHTYRHDFAEVVQRGSCLLIVEADDDDQFACASDITKRFGAIDTNEQAARPVRSAP